MNEAGLVGLVAHYGPYPVKSMMGEHIETVVVTERGILGDQVRVLTGDVGEVAAGEREDLDRQPQFHAGRL